MYSIEISFVHWPFRGNFLASQLRKCRITHPQSDTGVFHEKDKSVVFTIAQKGISKHDPGKLCTEIGSIISSGAKHTRTLLMSR